MNVGITSQGNIGRAAERDIPPVAIVAGDEGCGLLLLCDHAGNHVPPEYHRLGLPPAEMTRHIAYDPGAAGVTRMLAERLGAPAVMAMFSRLLIDANRGEDDPTLIMRLSDGTVVPGNAAVDSAEKQRRIDRFHAPYHTAVDDAIARAIAGGRLPALISIHSFTPVWRGHRRPWHAGILWDLDPRLAGAMIAALRAEGGLVIGDNEPYAGALAGDTMSRHATSQGLAHVLVEIRQDLIDDEGGQAAWAERLAVHLARFNLSGELHEIERFGSRAG
jgi:predicted N-formylglutamate amidohydrolase